MDISASSDDDDRRLFNTLDRSLTNRILRVKHNHPIENYLNVGWYEGMNEGAWRRLGHIIEQSTSISELEVRVHDDEDIASLCAGLRGNRSITSLNIHVLHTRGNASMISLAPILTANTRLKKIIANCIVGTASLNILTNALLTRPEDSIEDLEIYDNIGVDVDLDHLTLALAQCRKLKNLKFFNTGLGQKGCASLARLLKNQESNLESLHLNEKFLNDEAAILLAEALANNTKLRALNLIEENDISKVGWSALLRLICDFSGIDDILCSNHTCAIQFYSNGGFLGGPGRQKRVDSVLGTDNANLLRASGKMNSNRSNMYVARRKLIWSHARGNINLGDSAIDARVMPRILSWFLYESNTSLVFNMSLSLVQYHQFEYHDPPLPYDRVHSIQADSVYRILRSRPDLFEE